MRIFLMCSSLLLLAGCSAADFGSLKTGTALSSATDAVKAATLSDEEVMSTALQYARHADQANKIPAAGSAYAKRLARLTASHTKDSGLNLNFKVYMIKEPNAFALADGSIRVHSGLMDMLSDDELLSVIGHEIGHVKNGDSKAQLRTAYAVSAARKGVAAQGGKVAGKIAASQLGGFVEDFINAQYSQSQEESADDFGFEFLTDLPPIIFNIMNRNM